MLSASSFLTVVTQLIICWYSHFLYFCVCFSGRVWLTSALRALSLRCSLWLSWAEWFETGRPCPSRWIINLTALTPALLVFKFHRIKIIGHRNLNYIIFKCIYFVYCVTDFNYTKMWNFKEGCVFQYPLKEVVVIHQDPEALKDIQSLQKYILEVSHWFFISF